MGAVPYAEASQAHLDETLPKSSHDLFYRLARLSQRALQARAVVVLQVVPGSQPRCVASSGVMLDHGLPLPDWLQAAGGATLFGSNAVDSAPCSDAANTPDTPLGWTRACLSVPLRTTEFSGAVLALDDRNRAWDPDDVCTLQDMASLCLSALVNTLRGGSAAARDLGDPQRLMLFQKSLLESQTEASVDGILVVSNEGKVLLYNARFVRLWQLAPDLVSTHSDQRLLQEVNSKISDPDEFRARVAYLYQNPDEESRDNIPLKDGRIFDRYSAPVKGDDGTRYGRVWFFRDISEQVAALRRVEELAAELSSQQRWLEGLLDLLPVPVVLLDPEPMQVTFANKAADRCAGGTFPKGSLSLMPPALGIMNALRPAMERAARGEGLRSYQAEWRAPSGIKALLLHSEMLAASDGHRNVVVLAFDDVSELKRIESELQRSVRVRDEFLSIASHELKTPVTALHLQIQSVMRASQRDVARLSSEWLVTKISRAETQVQRLTRLIDNLLDVSRITAGRLEFEPEPLDLCQVAVDAAERLREEAIRVGSPLQVRSSAQVLGTWDRLRLEQVITNLITNAIKYGGGRPIELYVESLADGGIQLLVRDYGIGISQENQARIFERFERAVSERQYGGLGLGLWITRQIVEALNGKISVTSEPGQGSTFTVYLPSDSSATAPLAEAHQD